VVGERKPAYRQAGTNHGVKMKIHPVKQSSTCNCTGGIDSLTEWIK